MHFKAVFYEARNWWSVRGLAVLTAIVLAGAVFSLSFVAYNYASAGKLTSWEFNDLLLNKPFHLESSAADCRSVCIAGHSHSDCGSSLCLRLDPSRQSLRSNSIVCLHRCLRGSIMVLSSLHAFYRFTGINSPSAVVFNEQTVFIGLTWLVALISGIWLFRGWKDSRLTWARFHLASLPVWALTFAASTRYIEGFTVYLSYAAIIAAPTLVYAFAPMKRPRLNQLRWALLAFVGATHCFFASSILLTSSGRNLLVLMRAHSWPVSRGFAVDQSVQDEIGRASAGVYHHAIAWEQPYWVFMAYHPEIPQFMSRRPSPVQGAGGGADDPTSVALRYSRYVLMPRARRAVFACLLVSASSCIWARGSCPHS